jgi:type VI protein secretion system component VasK
MRIEHLARSVPGPLKRGVLVVLVLLLGVAAGLSALIGAAAITGRPPLFLLVGLVVFCLVYLLGLLLATRGIAPGRRQRVRTVVFGAGIAVVVSVFAATALQPLDDPRLPSAPVQDQRI